jgi:hypothetical protein
MSVWVDHNTTKALAGKRKTAINSQPLCDFNRASVQRLGLTPACSCALAGPTGLQA